MPHSLQPSLPQQFAGERLVGDAYFAKFYEDYEKIKEPGLLKFERIQSFQEPDSESWRAFIQGHWLEALELLNIHYEQSPENKYLTRRVRVVEKPVSPYLQWELHSLHLRDRLQQNTQVVVVDSGVIAEYEQTGPLPEIVTLGREVLYQVIYDEQGLYQEAIRFTNKQLIEEWLRFIEELLSLGEGIGSFFQREIAPLDAPTAQR